MRITYWALATCLLLLSSTSVLAGNRALLIGVGDYQLADINALPGIEKDIGMMREAALALGYKPGEIKVLLNKEATFRNVKKAIDEWLVDGVGTDDTALFYFSGHGTQIYDKDKDERDKVDEVLLCYDTAHAPNSLKNVIIDDMVHGMLKRIRSKNVFLFIDACHSGTATRSVNNTVNGVSPKLYEYPGMPEATRSASFVGKSIQAAELEHYSALSAAQDDQYALATKGGSLFTLGVSKAIAEAGKKNKPISMRQLHDYSTAYISTSAPVGARKHNPALVGNPDMNRKSMFIKDRAAREASWPAEIQALVEQASYPVKMKTNGVVFERGDLITISCSFKEGGYVNVITLQDGDQNPTVLFPNYYHQDNEVRAGTSLSIPAPEDKFDLTAVPPTGKALVAVFLTSHEVNFYREGFGKGVFKTLRRSGTRGIAVVARPSAPVESEQSAESAPPQEEENCRFGAGITFVTIK